MSIVPVTEDGPELSACPSFLWGSIVLLFAERVALLKRAIFTLLCLCMAIFACRGTGYLELHWDAWKYSYIVMFC